MHPIQPRSRTKLTTPQVKAVDQLSKEYTESSRGEVYELFQYCRHRQLEARVLAEYQRNLRHLLRQSILPHQCLILGDTSQIVHGAIFLTRPISVMWLNLPIGVAFWLEVTDESWKRRVGR